MDKAALFIYDPSTITSNAYTIDRQQATTPAAAGYQATGATANFYIDIGGDTQISQAANCEIANFNFLYKHDYNDVTAVTLELMKQPPSNISPYLRN